MRPHLEKFTGESYKSRQQELGIDLLTLFMLGIQSLCLETSKRTLCYLDSSQLAKICPWTHHVAILCSWTVLGHRLRSPTPLTCKALKGVFQHWASYPWCPLLCEFLLCNHQAIIYLMKLGKTTFSAKHFNLVLYSKTIAKLFYINLIHKHVHKGTTTKNIASWFRNKKFILYLH